MGHRVWPAVHRDVKFGVEVFTAIAYSSGVFQAGSVKRLTDAQVADLYIWLVEQVPYVRENEDMGGFRMGSPAESLAHLRDGRLFQLKARRTVQACDGIRRASSEFPERQSAKVHTLERAK